MDKIFAFGKERKVHVGNRGYYVFTIPAKFSPSGKPTHMLIHRWNWIQANGPIPEGYHIHHKDENKLNNSLDNLEMISSADHTSLHMDKGGHVGWHEQRQKWRAQVWQNGKAKYLGLFLTQHEAWNFLFEFKKEFWTEKRKIAKLLELGNDSFKRLAIKS